MNLIRLCFVALLSASAIGKVADMAGFFEVVETYRLVPHAFIPLVAWLLVAVELGLALWLLINADPVRAAVALVALHGVYLIWLLIALLRGLDIPNCGCFGVHWPRPLTWVTPLEDLVLLALALKLWVDARRARPKCGTIDLRSRHSK